MQAGVPFPCQLNKPPIIRLFAEDNPGPCRSTSSSRSDCKAVGQFGSTAPQSHLGDRGHFLPLGGGECIHVSECGHTHIAVLVCGRRETTSGVVVVFETGSLYYLLLNQASGSLLSVSPCYWHYRCALLPLALSDLWRLNLGPHTHVSMTLPAEPSPQSTSLLCIFLISPFMEWSSHSNL